jgi:phosphoserine phosphatase RsbU/P
MPGLEQTPRGRAPDLAGGTAAAAVALNAQGWPLAAMRKERFGKGDYLFRAGDAADRLFYISKGLVRLPELNVVVRPGQVLGEMGIFSQAHARTASAVCEADLEVFTMGRDEVVQLFTLNPSLALHLMQVSNQRFIENLKAETEARERINSELRIAQDIQRSMLPQIAPAFAGRPEFDLAALMEPAQEVGGDFYDAFFITPRKLCVVVGDVSGKGVPAALFMALTKTLLKSEAMRDYPLAEVFGQVNRFVSQDNSTCMFITVFAAVMDIHSGELECCNAGHPPPLVCGRNGQVRFLKATPQPAIGLIETARYAVQRQRLQTKELLLVYTDGVTEATDPQEQLFSEDRLERGLAGLSGQGPSAVVGELRRQIRSHAHGSAQSDDITLVGLQFSGAAGPSVRMSSGRRTNALQRPRRRP